MKAPKCGGLNKMHFWALLKREYIASSRLLNSGFSLVRDDHDRDEGDGDDVIYCEGVGYDKNAIFLSNTYLGFQREGWLF